MARKTQTQETAVSCGTLRERTRRAIVQLLKQEGRLDAETLAAHLGITAMAVRQHLYALQDEQLARIKKNRAQWDDLRSCGS
ncbi:MAG: hypothetical protein Kow00121_06140 [Elainellaceae cyanobacterium]